MPSTIFPARIQSPEGVLTRVEEVIPDDSRTQTHQVVRYQTSDEQQWFVKIIDPHRGSLRHFSVCKAVKSIISSHLTAFYLKLGLTESYPQANFAFERLLVDSDNIYIMSKAVPSTFTVCNTKIWFEMISHADTHNQAGAGLAIFCVASIMLCADMDRKLDNMAINLDTLQVFGFDADCTHIGATSSGDLAVIRKNLLDKFCKTNTSAILNPLSGNFPALKWFTQKGHFTDTTATREHNECYGEDKTTVDQANHTLAQLKTLGNNPKTQRILFNYYRALLELDLNDLWECTKNSINLAYPAYSSLITSIKAATQFIFRDAALLFYNCITTITEADSFRLFATTEGFIDQVKATRKTAIKARHLLKLHTDIERAMALGYGYSPGFIDKHEAHYHHKSLVPLNSAMAAIDTTIEVLCSEHHSPIQQGNFIQQAFNLCREYLDSVGDTGLAADNIKIAQTRISYFVAADDFTPLPPILKNSTNLNSNIRQFTARNQVSVTRLIKTDPVDTLTLLYLSIVNGQHCKSAHRKQIMCELWYLLVFIRETCSTRPEYLDRYIKTVVLDKRPSNSFSCLFKADYFTSPETATRTRDLVTAVCTRLKTPVTAAAAISSSAENEEKDDSTRHCAIM